MRVACPECAAEYEVPDAALGAARRLRCTACGTSWDWTPQAIPPPTPPPAPEPEPEPDQPAAAPEPRTEPPPADVAPPRIEVAREERIGAAPPPAPERGSGGVALAWLASFAILLAAAAALYVWRVPVMAAWPPATRLYAALGLA
jgi:predicted Zn finger-like uncharacterized protein